MIDIYPAVDTPSRFSSKIRLLVITAEDDGQKKSFIKSKGLGLSPIIEAGGTWKLATLSPRGNMIELSYPYLANYLA